MSDAFPAITAHGTTIEQAPQATPTVYTEIGETGDITMPGLMRNEFDASTHNRDIDSYVLGLLRRDGVTFPIFFNKGDASHIALRSSLIAGNRDGWRITSPDGDIWVFSGQIQAMSESAPVDGIKTAQTTIRPSGPFILNGIVYGT